MTPTTPRLSTKAVASLTSLLDEYTSFPRPRLAGTFLTVTSTQADSPLFLDAKGARNATIPPSEDPRGPVNPQTLLFIASCTKSIIAISILLLIQQGRIKSLDESVDPWIPEMKANGIYDATTGEIKPVASGKVITIGMLLDHTCGSVYPFKDPGLNAYAAKRKMPSVFTFKKASFVDLPLLFQPGEAWGYGLGLDWAVLLIERLLNDGTTFAQFAQTNIFDPLGMKRTTFTPRDLVQSLNQADGVEEDQEAKSMYTSKHGMAIHWLTEDGVLVPITNQHPMPAGGIWEGEGAEVPDVASGGAGIVSTIEDYGRYLSFLLSLSQYPSSPSEVGGLSIPSSLYLEPKIAQLLFTPHLTETQVEGLSRTLKDEGVVDPKGGYANLQHAFALAILPQGWEGGFGTGVAFWSGITCLFYFVDPKKKIAMMLSTQQLPYGAPAWKELLHKCIKVVYEDLE